MILQQSSQHIVEPTIKDIMQVLSGMSDRIGQFGEWQKQQTARFNLLSQLHQAQTDNDSTQPGQNSTNPNLSPTPYYVHQGSTPSSIHDSPSIFGSPTKNEQMRIEIYIRIIVFCSRHGWSHEAMKERGECIISYIVT